MNRLSKKFLKEIETKAKRIKKIYEEPNSEIDALMDSLRRERENLPKGVIAICEECGKKITEILDVQSWGGKTLCRECDKKRLEELKKELEL